MSLAPWLLHLHPASYKCFPLVNGPFPPQAFALTPQQSDAHLAAPFNQSALL